MKDKEFGERLMWKPGDLNILNQETGKYERIDDPEEKDETVIRKGKHVVHIHGRK